MAYRKRTYTTICIWCGKPGERERNKSLVCEGCRAAKREEWADCRRQLWQEREQLVNAVESLRHELRVHARTRPFDRKSYVIGRKRADELMASTKKLLASIRAHLPAPPISAPEEPASPCIDKSGE